MTAIKTFFAIVWFIIRLLFAIPLTWLSVSLVQQLIICGILHDLPLALTVIASLILLLYLTRRLIALFFGPLDEDPSDASEITYVVVACLLYVSTACMCYGAVTRAIDQGHDVYKTAMLTSTMREFDDARLIHPMDRSFALMNEAMANAHIPTEIKGAANTLVLQMGGTVLASLVFAWLVRCGIGIVWDR